MLNFIGTSNELGLAWPGWFAAAGMLAFCGLAAYAIALLHAARHPESRLRPPQPATLRGRTLLALILVSAIPLMSLSLVMADRAARQNLDDISALLEEQVRGLSRVADFLIAEAHSELDASADDLTGLLDAEPAILEAQLRDQLERMPNFTRLIIIDHDGKLLAAFSDRPGEDLPPSVLLNADRTGTRWQRNAQSGYAPRIHHGTERSIVLLAAVIPGARTGDAMLVGEFNLQSIQRFRDRLIQENEVGTMLLDAAGHPVFVTGPGDYAGISVPPVHQLLAARERSGGTDLFGITKSGQTGKQSWIAAGSSMAAGWQVFLYRSLANVEAQLLGAYLVAIAWLAFGIITSACLAIGFSTSIARPLEELQTAVRRFRPDLDVHPTTPGADAPSEVLSVFRHVTQVGARMRASYEKLRNANRQGEKLRGELIYVIATREKEIEDRTEELRDANEKLECAIREDSLTGLANRRHLKEFLKRAWRIGLRERSPMSVLLIDIDHFKAFNDAYGHQVGDNCLKAVADTIAQVVGRPTDLAARYGGEEFVVILGNTALDGALRVGENIRRSIEALDIPHRGAPDGRPVTVSIGAASTLPARGMQPNKCIEAADRALYNAKEHGRNRVAWSTSSRTGVFQSLCLPGNLPSRPS